MSDLAYRIVIRPLSEDDGGGFVAMVPDLRGCMGDGDTPEEALKDCLSAIGEWKDEALRVGRQIPAPGSQAKAAREEAERVVDHIDRQHRLIEKQDDLIAAQKRLIEASEEAVAIVKGMAERKLKPAAGSDHFRHFIIDWEADDAVIPAVPLLLSAQYQSRKVLEN